MLAMYRNVRLRRIPLASLILILALELEWGRNTLHCGPKLVKKEKSVELPAEVDPAKAAFAHLK